MSRFDDATLQVLDNYAEYFAASWLAGYQIGRPDRNREWLAKQFYDFTFKDEHEYLIDAVRGNLGTVALQSFDVAIDNLRAREPREDEVFERLLAEKLAVDRNGNHLNGKRGKTQISGRVVGTKIKTIYRTSRVGRKLIKMLQNGEAINEDAVRQLLIDHELQIQRNVKWPIYYGEEEERGAIAAGERDFDTEGLDPIDMIPMTGGALVPNISAEIAILGLDALADGVDEGTASAVIQGRDGSQPADPDAATTGTLGFELQANATMFNAATDQGDGTVDAAAAAITDDTSANATITLGYCRVSATNSFPTPIDDHIDGEAGTSGANFNFNTVSIVSGANVSMTSLVLTLDQGATAT